MNFSTTPPSASTAARQRPKYSRITSRIVSAPSRAVSGVESTRSPNRAVTSLRCSPLAAGEPVPPLAQRPHRGVDHDVAEVGPLLLQRGDGAVQRVEVVAR